MLSQNIERIFIMLFALLLLRKQRRLSSSSSSISSSTGSTMDDSDHDQGLVMSPPFSSNNLAKPSSSREVSQPIGDAADLVVQQKAYSQLNLRRSPRKSAQPPARVSLFSTPQCSPTHHQVHHSSSSFQRPLPPPPSASISPLLMHHAASVSGSARDIRLFTVLEELRAEIQQVKNMLRTMQHQGGQSDSSSAVNFLAELDLPMTQSGSVSSLEEKLQDKVFEQSVVCILLL